MSGERVLVWAAVALLLVPLVFYGDARGLLIVSRPTREFGFSVEFNGSLRDEESYVFLLHPGDAVYARASLAGCGGGLLRYRYSVERVGGGFSYRGGGRGVGSASLPVFLCRGEGLYVLRVSFEVEARGECRLVFEGKAVRGFRGGGEYLWAALAGGAALGVVAAYGVGRRWEGF